MRDVLKSIAGLAGSAALAAMLTVAPARADDKSACEAGIAMIQAEIAKGPAEPALAKLKKALRVAERERGEGEFDECLDAVNDARRAVAK